MSRQSPTFQDPVEHAAAALVMHIPPRKSTSAAETPDAITPVNITAYANLDFCDMVVSIGFRGKAGTADSQEAGMAAQ
jgi:hypothetical protein